jgi:hypothetical protein
MVQKSTLTAGKFFLQTKSPIQVQNYDFISFANFVKNETHHYEQKNSRAISVTKKTTWNT